MKRFIHCALLLFSKQRNGSVGTLPIGKAIHCQCMYRAQKKLLHTFLESFHLVLTRMEYNDTTIHEMHINNAVGCPAAGGGMARCIGFILFRA
ncbi:hypothetical protein, partial [Geobacillus thermoleovorans]|uniref:hypothetical protein n=1 Tax=Geobacillus thermoleovorans TaxID=33941 RepID=UPI003DA299CE